MDALPAAASWPHPLRPFPQSECLAWFLKGGISLSSPQGYQGRSFPLNWVTSKDVKKNTWKALVSDFTISKVSLYSTDGVLQFIM